MTEIRPEDILKIRVEEMLTQVQLGAMVGVTGKTVSLWERGLSKPRAKNAALIQKLLEAMDEKAVA